jgi:hypothetical protein
MAGNSRPQVQGTKTEEVSRRLAVVSVGLQALMPGVDST